ncbi:hypothetical protein M440DRAFT_1389455 [Trichoderma longibrachiatum ATCC 18648]|uniref:Uncharacterized protein n=1 Tax=Trichoderma longibrachiatum ATCC 18648 TaxID=983965 RepID=A0A2T4CD40_TRILO|nr:hypothetical protein M440DRAFT_1389455 [Trichoderma longibrachiatum ATCC 18648]
MSSSSAARSGERMIHQDFIARIRFSNALPPPPNPPKLLDIPNTGLASGQYTTPQKAVYYYPIMQKSTIRPQRTKNIARTNYGLAEDDEVQVVDQLELTVEDPTEEMRGAMKMYAEHPLGWDQEEGAEEHEHEHIEQSIEEADVDADGEEAERNGASSPGGQEQRSPSAERDAEGDEDEDED